jgi:hypothetical protein
VAGWVAGCFAGTHFLSLSGREKELGVGAQEGEKLYICAGRWTEGAAARGAAMAMDFPALCQLLGARPGLYYGSRPNLYRGPCATWETGLAFVVGNFPWKNRCFPGKRHPKFCSGATSDQLGTILRVCG